MAFRDLFNLRETSTPDPEVTQLRGALETAQFRLEEATHSMEKFYQEDVGWEQINSQAQQDMSPEGRRRATELCRVMKIANPLVKRGLAVRAGYVFGQGVGIQAPDGTEPNTQDVNSVVQAFLDDQGNRRAFTGAQARAELENSLGTDGNVFAVVFTNPNTGFVRVRTIDSLEVTDQITNPDDASETWFYRRDFVQTRVGERTSRVTTSQKTVWYPALNHRPTRRQSTIEGNPVDWSAAVYHIRVNTVGKWGLGDAYAALPWARAYKEFLEDWAKLMSALSRIAWKLSSKKSVSQQARSSLSSLGEAGGVATMDSNTQLEAVPKSGATIDAESGRPLATMVAAAFGIPVTILLADPGATGARAVAETLDRPTLLEMGGRQEVWAEAYRAILEYVIDQSVLAPQGLLKGGVKIDPHTQQEDVQLRGAGDRTLVITWPDMNDTPIDVMVNAITMADSTGKVPPLETMRLILRALGVRDVDEILESWTDDNGGFINPNDNIGDAAIAAFNRGEDPTKQFRRGSSGNN